MDNKYNITIAPEHYTMDINRLTNQLWKLIPMKENNEDWQSQLGTVIIEIVGLHEIFNHSEKFLILLSKLEGIKKEKVEFQLYRKTVFESISLLREIRL